MGESDSDRTVSEFYEHDHDEIDEKFEQMDHDH